MGEILALLGIRRKRSPVEADLRLTNAYARFIIATGFARLGDHAYARSLGDESVAELEPDRTDRVHAYLVAAFSARIEHSCAALPRDFALPHEVISRRTAMTPQQRYKVDRLHDLSPTLAGKRCSPSGGAAIERFEQSVVFETPQPPTVGSHELELLLEQTGFPNPAAIAAGLDGLMAMSETAAVPVLARAVRRMVVEAHVPALLCERAITAAARFGYGELVPDLLARLPPSSEELSDVLPDLSPRAAGDAPFLAWKCALT
jgi:hypothetical protein